MLDFSEHELEIKAVTKSVTDIDGIGNDVNGAQDETVVGVKYNTNDTANHNFSVVANNLVDNIRTRSGPAVKLTIVWLWCQFHW